jgi:HlyD family secretion protein
MKKLLVLIVLLAAGGAGGFLWWQRSAQPTASFRTAPVQRGDLLITISATGTVEPEEVVDVGAQVAGKIESFGADPANPGRPVDYGTHVEKGTVLARIDPSLYAADVEQATAQYEQAKANIQRAQADLAQMRAKLHQAEQDWKRAETIGTTGGALSASDFDNYRAIYETARATVGVGEASVVQAEKAAMQSEAMLKRSKTNLGYCTIQSPVKGVIIDRRVNIGQTVVASLNAPSLFLIAKDLTRIQVWASVNEADIGSIRAGQGVTFTVDAYPGRTFTGRVNKIRLNASMTQNVVTYTVEITTDNSDGKLLPYLTANVRFEVTQKENAVTVPNAALRWTPSPDQVVPEARIGAAGFSGRGGGDGGGSRRGGGNRPAGDRGNTSRPDGDRSANKAGTIWVPDGAFVRPIPVKVGLSDGTATEVSGEAVREGLEVVVGENSPGTPGGGPGGSTASPFMPRFFGSGRRG